MRKVVLVVFLGLLLTALGLISLQAQTPCLVEVEPNDFPWQANPVSVSDCIVGSILLGASDQDVFVISTTAGSEYQGNLDIDSPQGLYLRAWLHDTDYWINAVSEPSVSHIRISWIAESDIYYIRLTTSDAFLPPPPATASYRLDVTVRHKIFLPVVQH